MPKTTAGIALYRRTGDAATRVEIFLVHPGGPYWKNKDDGSWSFPKGEHADDEDPLLAARREFHEETGCDVAGDFVALGPITQRGGKLVRVWAVEGDCDASAIRSNTFSVEWPPRSGRCAEFPEVDRAGWFSPQDARRKLLPAQAQLVDRLCELLGV